MKEIASAIGSPVAFTAKILQDLSKNDLVMASKGPGGGYEIPIRAQSEISLYQIVKAIDGDGIFHGCGLGLPQCNEKQPCSIHFKFKSIRNELKRTLQSITIDELANDVGEGAAFLKRDVSQFQTYVSDAG